MNEMNDRIKTLEKLKDKRDAIYDAHGKWVTKEFNIDELSYIMNASSEFRYNNAILKMLSYHQKIYHKLLVFVKYLEDIDDVNFSIKQLTASYARKEIENQNIISEKEVA